MNILAVTAVLVAALIGSSDAIKCYECTYINAAGVVTGASGCQRFSFSSADSGVTERDCGSSISACTTTEVEVNFLGVVTKTTTRGCSALTCDQQISVAGTTIDCCSGELCNASGRVMASVTAVVLPALVYLFSL